MSNPINPFNISFGKEPMEKIERPVEMTSIIEDFESPNPESNVYVISGARESGKTILLSSLRSYYEKEPDWVVVSLLPQGNILELFASMLYEEGKLRKLFLKGEFSFSFHGLSFTLQGENPVTNIVSLLDYMLSYLKAKKQKTIVFIDEVAPNPDLKQFFQAFQLFLSKKYDVYLVMTGLYGNIESVEREKSSTFLLRAPKIYLGPLDLASIAAVYEKTLGCSRAEAVQLAKESKGYAFAYQLIGSILFKAHKTKLEDDDLRQLDQLLKARSYQMIYDELSDREKQIVMAAATLDDPTTGNVIEAVGVSKGTISVYKDRLENEGIIEEKRGGFFFALPRFKEFLQEKAEFED